MKTGRSPLSKFRRPLPRRAKRRERSIPSPPWDLRVEHPGYQQEVVEDAQVFPGVNSLQEVELIPMAEHEIPRNSYNIVQITPQPLT